MTKAAKPSVDIRYCPKCKWLTRAAWYAQELLSTYVEDLQHVRLTPSEIAGEFKIGLDGHVIMDRNTDGFLEAKLLKRRVRDLIDPHRELGHVDG